MFVPPGTAIITENWVPKKNPTAEDNITVVDNSWLD